LSNFTNQIVASSTGAETGGTVLVNGGDTRHYGVEAAAIAELGKTMKWPLAVDVGARGWWSHATFVGGTFGGNALPYAPLYSWTGTVDVDHPFGLGGQIAWTHVASQYVDQANTRIEDSTGRYGLIPAYDILDLGARYKHKKSGITLKLVVKNALDNVYVSARRPEGIQTAGFRQVMLGLRWDWEKAAEPPPTPTANH
jgi:Fe(3+) dicitrate transport protein